MMNKGDEAARLADLRRYRILDTEPEEAFDDLTALASQICGAPIALITLVDADRQWFKSRVGVSMTETSRSVSVCAHAMNQRALFVVPDARDDERFRNNPMVVGAPNIRFYAGASLASADGRPLGSLCVIDNVPRTLTPEQAESLERLRRQAEGQLELRRNLAELKEALLARDRAEAAQTRLIDELREALDHVSKLSGLLPYCSTCQFNIVVPADASAIGTVTDGFTKVLQDKGWSEAEVHSVDLALREALANAIHHGCGDDPTKKVQCVVTYEDTGEIVIVVRDPGPGFDTAAVPNPLEGQNIFKSSGRGVFLINQLMDAVGFRDGGREVEMRKRRDKDAAAPQ
jgi:anti-sigma regulatory factor (Ser/Thr protein kinase)